MSPIIIGIDPGLKGALAALTTLGDLTVHDMPVLTIERGGKSKSEVDTASLVLTLGRWRNQCADLHAVIEKVGAMPGQGVTSMFSFGRSVGQIEGVLAGLQIPVTYVTPQAWQKALSVPKGKDGSRLRASQIMPAYAGEWRRAKDDGRAEAALIAMWGVLHLPEVKRAQDEAARNNLGHGL